ncbi:DUF4129 domain-containing protein [Streptomyces sp. NPDC059816]|uniref:DUF4129 domain-containing protein n=1 Tax=Streptomyces sp. NPDC059816 TaxID=3346960 RepID=UPI0036561D58
MGATGGTLTTTPPVGARRGLLAGDDAPPLTTPRDPAREAAEDELSRPVYQEHAPSLFQRALDAFLDWVEDLFGAASGVAPGGAAGLVVLLLFVVALVAALWWRLGSPTRTPVTSAPLFGEVPRSAAEHRAAAEAHAARGDWNPALQERMRAVVRSLEERALLDARPGRTADEAAAEAGRPLPGHADRLRDAARSFDDVTYGGRTTDGAGYARLAELDTELQRTRPVLADAATAGHPGGPDADRTRGGAA